MATCEDLKHSKEEANFFRYIALLNDGGRLVLKETYKKEVPGGNIIGYLKPKQEEVRKKYVKGVKGSKQILYPEQFDILYPKNGETDPDKYDFTLLTFLLRNLSNLDSELDVWSTKTVPSDDTTKPADITRLRLWRNKIAHAETSELADDEFEKRWNELKNVLLNLGKDLIPDLEGSISGMETRTLHSKREEELQQVIDTWKEKYIGLADDIHLLKQSQ